MAAPEVEQETPCQSCCRTQWGLCQAKYLCECHRRQLHAARARAMRTALEYSIRTSWPHEAPER